MNLDLDDAVDEWLDARLQWLRGIGRDKLERFTTATDLLYAAFAEGWTGDERSLFESFEHFRKSLIEDKSWTFRRLDVATIYPHRIK